MARLSPINIAIAVFLPKTGFVLEKSLATPKPFQTGQVWELPDSNVQIRLVGKLLVHYKHYKTKQPRVQTSLTSKAKLEKFLRDNRAILVQE